MAYRFTAPSKERIEKVLELEEETRSWYTYLVRRGYCTEEEKQVALDAFEWWRVTRILYFRGGSPKERYTYYWKWLRGRL